MELKNCPFCGGEADYENEGSWEWYECDSCGTQIASKNMNDTSISLKAAWNTRPIEDALRVEIETLKAKIKEMEEREDDQRLEAKNERD